jgi:protein TonB
MRCAVLSLSLVALLAGCASSQQARAEPVAMEPAAVSTSVAATPVAVSTAAPTESQSDSSTATSNSSTAPTYYGAHDFDIQTHPLHKIEPNYPAEADSQGVSGKVVLQLMLEADGRVGDIKVVSATPPGVFEGSAIAAFREARFAPAQKAGRPVRAQILIEVVYDWDGPVP